MISVALLLLVQPAPTVGPREVVSACLADLRKLPPEVRLRVRYVSMWDVPTEQLAGEETAFRFHCYVTSPEADGQPPIRVAPGLWRIDLVEQGWDAKVWEKLLDVGEPYFHVKALISKVEYEYVEMGYWSTDGGRSQCRRGTPTAVWYKTGTEKRKKEVEVQAGADWLDAKELGTLINLTQSQIPVVNWGWFLFHTGTSRDVKGKSFGYYDFLGIPDKLADLEKQLGADKKVSAKRRLQLKSVVGRSIVAHNPREIDHEGAVGENYWITNDFEAAVDRSNVLRLLNGDAKPQAHELYFRLPNGYWGTGLFGGDGKRVNAAPFNIASDGKAPGTIRDVQVGISCYRCHEDGLQRVDNWARDAYGVPFSLDSPDLELQKELRSKYLRDMQERIADRNTDYAKVVQRHFNVKPAKLHGIYAEAWKQYELHDRTIEDTARSLGVPVKAWKDKLAQEAQRNKKLDPVLAVLHQGRPVRVEWWEEVYPLAQTIVRAP